jgi:tellurite resistance protein TerC
MQLLDVVVWGSFLAFVLGLLALDLGVFHRETRVIRLGEALAWSGFYLSLALGFAVLVYFLYERNWLGVGVVVGHPLEGHTAALQFVTGYLLEQSLSLDNVFVIALIFAYFRVPLAYQHRVLFWGILGALVMRGTMIGIGAALIARFDWVIYVFGGVLLVTAARMLLVGHEDPEPEKNWLIRSARRVYPITPEFHGDRFFVSVEARRIATPLLLVLLMVESSDVLFAVDSIPAIFAVTQDPFLVFTSNIFAILGLRNLYFVIAPLLNQFRYLKQSLVFILAFVGVKMILSHSQPIPTPVSLAVIVGILGVGVLASALARHRRRHPEPPHLPDGVEGDRAGGDVDAAGGRICDGRAARARRPAGAARGAGAGRRGGLVVAPAPTAAGGGGVRRERRLRAVRVAGRGGRSRGLRRSDRRRGRGDPGDAPP